MQTSRAAGALRAPPGPVPASDRMIRGSGSPTCSPPRAQRLPRPQSPGSRLSPSPHSAQPQYWSTPASTRSRPRASYRSTRAWRSRESGSWMPTAWRRQTCHPGIQFPSCCGGRSTRRRGDERQWFWTRPAFWSVRSLASPPWTRSRRLTIPFRDCPARCRIPKPRIRVQIAGGLAKGPAADLGLQAGTPVAVGSYDSYIDLARMGTHEPGDACILLGSTQVVGQVANPSVALPARQRAPPHAASWRRAADRRMDLGRGPDTRLVRWRARIRPGGHLGRRGRRPARHWRAAGTPLPGWRAGAGLGRAGAWRHRRTDRAHVQA